MWELLKKVKYWLKASIIYIYIYIYRYRYIDR